MNRARSRLVLHTSYDRYAPASVRYCSVLETSCEGAPTTFGIKLDSAFLSNIEQSGLTRDR